jgi:hypothetical protein
MSRAELTSIEIPRHVLVKLVNRRRMLVFWQLNGAGPETLGRSRAEHDVAEDDLCTWAEEHAPHLVFLPRPKPMR